jgi:hypothetical protein
MGIAGAAAGRPAVLPSASPQVKNADPQHPLRDPGVQAAQADAGTGGGGQGRWRYPGDLPTDVILYAYYSRTCDPAVDYMKDYGRYSDDQIVDYMRAIIFAGIGAADAG